MIHILGVPDSSKYQRVERKVEELHSGQIRPVQKWKFHGGQSNAASPSNFLFVLNSFSHNCGFFPTVWKILDRN